MDTETELWEEILKQHGLGENRGRNTDWLDYGARYFDHDEALSYDTAGKRPDPRTAAAFDKANRLRGLMRTGLSMKRAAKQLNIPQSSAVRILKRHALSTLSTSYVSSEGKQ